MNSFQLTVLAADKPYFAGECVSLVLPTTQGLYGVQAMHSNMIAAIIPGMLRATLPGGKRVIAAVSEGLVKVEDNEVLVLVDTAEHPDEIDENIALRAAAEAKEAMLQKRSIQEYHAAEARLARAINRLMVKKYDELH